MAKTLTWIVGVVLTIVGIWGYLSPSGTILGIFAVNGIHNLIHLLSGVVAILAARGGEKHCKTYLQVFGVIYAIVFLLGIFTPGEKILNLITSNIQDDILHLVIAVVLLYGGFGDKMKMGGAPATT